MIELIKFDSSDIDFYHKLKSEESNVFWSGYLSKPTKESIVNWYERNVVRGDVLMYLIKYNGQDAGVIYYRVKSSVEIEYLGLGIIEKYQGMGLATQSFLKLLAILRTIHPSVKYISAFIRIDHMKSRSIHQKLGFVETNEKVCKINKCDIESSKWVLIVEE